MAGAELPCLIVNVARGGPGLGTIQPSQADYFQTVKGGGHGDYHMIVLAPYTVQEQYDFVKLGFDLAFKYTNPVMILSDGAIGQMMEKVTLSEQLPRVTPDCDWATTGKPANRNHRYITSLYLLSEVMEQKNLQLQAKYAKIRENEVRYEEIKTEDADYLLVAYGISARIARKVVRLARAEGIKIGILRPITLWPFPSARLKELAGQVKGMLTIEMSAGQMIEDVRLAVEGAVLVKHYGRMGGVTATPTEVFINFKKLFNIE